MSAVLDYLKQWWAERLHPYNPMETVGAPYPRVLVEWGEAAPLDGDVMHTQALPRDCGHWSRSYAYDPLRETSSCLECYRRRTGRKGGA